MPEGVTPEQLLGERIAGRFVVEKAIGHGPLSSAFRARDERLHRRVTVKLFHPQHADDVEVVDAQLELAKSVARLSHPNIATVIDRGEHEGMPFIVLEYVRGENLQERIDRYAPLRVAEVVELAQSIARALQYAHAHGVAHGNLRPENVLISEDREVKLVDFGGGSSVAALAGAGSAFIAPERHDELVGDADAAGDVFALGVVLFVALTEREPELHIDASRVQLLRPDVSPRLAATIARALAPDPESRYASMNELMSDLSTVRVSSFDANGTTSVFEQPTGLMQVVEAEPLEAPPAHAAAETPEPRPQRRPRPPRRADRARMAVWGMVLVPLAAVVLVGFMLAGEQGRDGDAGNTPRAVSAQPEKVQIVGAQTLDPFDPDKTGEHDELVDRVYEGGSSFDDDNNPSYWETQNYDTADMVGKVGGHGVGVMVEVEKPVEAREMRITSDPQGWTAQIYAADQRLTTFDDGWKPVSESMQITNRRKVPLGTDGRKYPVYLIWITNLSYDTNPQGSDGFKVRIGDVDVLA